MERIVVKPKCATCSGSLEIEKIFIDFNKSEYQVDSFCLSCGEPNRCELNLEDFIGLNELLIKKLGGELVVGVPEQVDVYRGENMAQLKGLSDYLKDEPINDWKVLIFKKEIRRLN